MRDSFYILVLICFMLAGIPSKVLSAEINSTINCNVLEKIDLVELANVFTVNNKGVDISPSQIVLDFDQKELISLTVNYSEKTFFNSIEEWVSKQYPTSLVLSTKEPLMALWRNEKNAVAINLSLTECGGVQLIILRIQGGEYKERMGDRPR